MTATRPVLLTLTLLVCLSWSSVAGDSCFDVNVRYNGNSLTVTNAKSREECGAQCEARGRECGAWTWEGGRCDMKKADKPGDKVPSKGEVVFSGSGSTSCNSSVTAVSCSYTDNNQQVHCIFPFIGENPGQKSGGSSHDGCLKTKRGRFWCATKVNRDNRVIGTSVQNRDVSCSRERRCAPPQSQTTKSTTKATTRRTTKTTSSGGSSSSADGVVTEAELKAFTEELIKIDDDNVAGLVSVDAGCSTKVGRPTDCSPGSLITRVDPAVLKRPVYRRLQALYENYDNDVTVVEDRTRSERAEEDALLEEIMKSKVMIKTLEFLKSEKVFTKSSNDFKKLLKELWFDVYSREKKNGAVQGFHNWVYFHHLEKLNKLNYLGHWKKVDFGRGTGLAFTFKWGEEQKPFASMMIGTSPEFELSLYTTCLLVRGDGKCRVSLGGKPVTVTTHVFTRPRGVRYIASAFMDWD